MYSDEDEAENMEEYINGTYNSSQDDETDEQQSFFHRLFLKKLSTPIILARMMILSNKTTLTK